MSGDSCFVSKVDSPGFADEYPELYAAHSAVKAGEIDDDVVAIRGGGC